MTAVSPQVPLRVITAAEVRASVSRARRSLEQAAEEILWQVEMEAWRTLGYSSWKDMREAEYGGAAVMLPTGSRPEVTARLKAIPIGRTARGGKKHLSDQEIADTLGVDRTTVKRDLGMDNKKVHLDQNVEAKPEEDVIDAEVVDGYKPQIECSSCAGDFNPEVITEMDEQTLLCPDCLDAVETSRAGQLPAAAHATQDVDAADPVIPEQSAGEKPKARRAPITDQARDAGWELRKAAERIERIVADDRFGATKEKVAQQMRGHLTDAISSCQAVLDRLNQ